MTGAPRSAGSLIRKIVAALILVPLAIVIIALAVANRQRVTLSLDPFGTDQNAAFTAPPLPLFLVLIATLILGVVIGGAASWLRHGGWRRTARRLQRELAALRGDIDALRRGAGAASAGAPQTAEPPERLKLKPPGH